MCGRFAFYSPHEAVTRLFGVADAPGNEPRYNVAPTQFMPVIVPPDAYADWLDADNAATDRLARLLELVESLGGGDDAP